MMVTLTVLQSQRFPLRSKSISLFNTQENNDLPWLIYCLMELMNQLTTMVVQLMRLLLLLLQQRPIVRHQN
jgi:hypothetical protein